MRRTSRLVLHRALLVATAVASAGASAQDGFRALNPVVVTATRSAAPSFDVPASIDSIDASTLQQGQPMVNLSETLTRVPGLVALNRQNYAQDLQISSRGFGARATFGVRGIRLYQDDIPATMPDGQGQTGSFSLMSAQRIEVLRGPFSTLYGNAAGGVIAVFTEDGTPRPELTINGGAGSFESFTAGAKLTGSSDPAHAGYVLAASRFDTEGYRDHSSARRDVANVKLTLDPAADTHVTFIASSQYQPETQDPLGLTRAQWQANPRGVDPAALLFDTRKTILQQQGGATVEQRLGSGVTIKAMAYAGRRGVRQYLALTGVGATSSGGITDLDRDYGGGSVRVNWRATTAGLGSFNVTAGIDVDRQDERRRGFVNNNGAMGDLRRDENDRVDSTAAYAQAEWSPLLSLSLTAGVRAANVKFRSLDHYITAQNPDDSGAKSFGNTSPVLGAVWHASERVNVYASYGEGFETPTLIELAYRSSGTGLNFALEPATSRAFEAGVKTLVGERQRINVAAFVTNTSSEIVIDAATGGRTTYKNAGRTRRRGLEAMWDARLADTLTAHVAYTWLRAEFADAFTSAGAALVPAGARLPGVPSTSAYAELAWAPGGFAGFSAALEAQHQGALFVNDQNSDAAPAVTLFHARVGFAQQLGMVQLREFLRLNNVTDRSYVGSVIVGDTNGRYFEPAPGRNWFAGVTARAVF